MDWEDSKNDRLKIDDPKYNLDRLKNESTRILSSWRLEQKLIEAERTTEEEFEYIKLCVREAAEEALGLEDRKTKKTYWWDIEIEEKIKQKKELYQKLLQNQHDETKTQYKSMNREVKQEVIRKKNNAWEIMCEYIDNPIGCTRSSEAWRTIKSIRKSNKTNTVLNNILDKQWLQHFEELLTETRPTSLQGNI